MPAYTCYGRSGGADWAQAGKRARELRKAGYRVVSCGASMQTTRAGKVKLTMLDIRGDSPPHPAKLVRI